MKSGKENIYVACKLHVSTGRVYGSTFKTDTRSDYETYKI